VFELYFSISISDSIYFAHKTALKHACWDTREQDAQGTYCAPTRDVGAEPQKFKIQTTFRFIASQKWL